jgi:hypothetical protein
MYLNAQTIPVAGGIIVVMSGAGGLDPSFAVRNLMLYTTAVVLVILWQLGLVTPHTLGGFIHKLGLKDTIVLTAYRHIAANQGMFFYMLTFGVGALPPAQSHAIALPGRQLHLDSGSQSGQ